MRNEYNKKCEWLCNKWKPRKKPKPDIIRSIVLKDEELKTEFSSEPRLYGNVMIDEQEKNVLSLPPNFGVYKKVDVQSCIIETEKGLNKIRWKRKFGNNADTEERTFVNKTTRVVNVNLLRATDLPFNPSVKMPNAVHIQEEIVLQKFKNEVKTIAERIKK